MEFSFLLFIFAVTCVGCNGLPGDVTHKSQIVATVNRARKPFRGVSVSKHCLVVAVIHNFFKTHFIDCCF